MTNRGMNESVACAREQMGEFLALRRQPGDAEKAFEHYQRSLELREEIAKASPGSPLVARDLALYLQRFARFLAHRGLSGDEEQALNLQTRALQVLIKLHHQHPASVFHGLPAAQALYGVFRIAKSTGNESLANESLSGCFQVLEQMLRHGAELDPPVLQFHSRLKAIVNPLP